MISIALKNFIIQKKFRGLSSIKHKALLDQQKAKELSDIQRKDLKLYEDFIDIEKEKLEMQKREQGRNTNSFDDIFNISQNENHDPNLHMPNPN